VSDDPEDFDDIPLPPDPEFDRDAQYALAQEWLSHEQRDRITGEARNLAARGLTREATGFVERWPERSVARVVLLRRTIKAT
jgi:hypothetical protein